MTVPGISSFVRDLADVARSERRYVLQSMVVAQFRVALLMEPSDDLPLTANYFELGMTSLLVVGLKQQLETVLGCPIDTATLFASPTIAQVMQHLCDECLPDLFAARLAEGHQTIPPAPRESQKRLLDDLLADLYQD